MRLKMNKKYYVFNRKFNFFYVATESVFLVYCHPKDLLINKTLTIKFLQYKH